MIERRSRENRGAEGDEEGGVRGGGFPLPAGGGFWGGGCSENFSLFSLEKAHFGGYLIPSDVLILKSWFAVHRMLQGCAANSVNFFPTGCSLWGLSPIAPDKLRPCLPPFSSTRFYCPPFLFLLVSFLVKLTRCSYAAACSL